MTSLQKSIGEVLERAQRPLTVPELMVLLKRKKFTPHKTSLYRNLEKMVADGSVEEVLLDAETVYYEYKSTHHHHAQCGACSAVLCIANKLLEKSMTHLEKAAKKSGFIPSEHHVVLRGICASCKDA